MTENKEQRKKIFGEVLTPMSLVNNMLGKLPVEVWSNPNLTWCDPAVGTGNFLLGALERLMNGLEKAIPDSRQRKKHILENMLFGCELQLRNVLLTRGCLDPENKYKLNIKCADSLKFDFWGKKFDVVMGNPPYQAEKHRVKATNKGTCGTIIWDQFVYKGIELTKDNGYLCFVHPAGWRRPNKNTIALYHAMTSLQMDYLEMHSIRDGESVFGACTQYDWYVLKNCPNSGTTMVKGQDGNVCQIDLRDWPVLPNSQFDTIKGILAKDGEPKCEILHSYSAYETRSDWISEVQCGLFQHPCVYSLPQKGIQLKYSNTKTNGHFGVPKVIFSNGAASQVIIDKDGKYGLTQFAYGIVDDVENLPKIKKAMESKKFVDLCGSFRFTLDKYDDDFISLFRKDFWKEFV